MPTRVFPSLFLPSSRRCFPVDFPGRKGEGRVKQECEETLDGLPPHRAPTGSNRGLGRRAAPSPLCMRPGRLCLSPAPRWQGTGGAGMWSASLWGMCLTAPAAGGRAVRKRLLPALPARWPEPRAAESPEEEPVRARPGRGGGSAPPLERHPPVLKLLVPDEGSTGEGWVLSPREEEHSLRAGADADRHAVPVRAAPRAGEPVTWTGAPSRPRPGHWLLARGSVCGCFLLRSPVLARSCDLGPPSRPHVFLLFPSGHSVGTAWPLSPTAHTQTHPVQSCLRTPGDRWGSLRDAETSPSLCRGSGGVSSPSARAVGSIPLRAHARP